MYRRALSVGGLEVVAYSFRRRFVNPIKAGLGLPVNDPYVPPPKRQTIRADRKRHARLGEEVQLYCGMRTKGCFLIGTARCISVDVISLHFGRRDWVKVTSPSIDLPRSLDQFAQSDGFVDWAELREFWREEHDADDFTGVLIKWEPING